MPGYAGTHQGHIVSFHTSHTSSSEQVSSSSSYTRHSTAFRWYHLTCTSLTQTRVWDPADQCTGGPTTQYTRTIYLMTTSLLDISTDLVCLILPVVIIRTLRMDTRKKIALGVSLPLLFHSLTSDPFCSRMYEYGL